MLVIIGIVVVMFSVVGGYILEKGNVAILFQPVEAMIIFGAAIGAFLIANPPGVVAAVLKNLPAMFTAVPPNKKSYLNYLSLLYGLFSKIRKDGPLSVEGDIENPKQSELFKKYKINHELVQFICDNVRMVVSANIPPFELESLIDLEIDTHHEHALEPSHAVNRIADGLPGLGIVAAVIGVVLTMGKIDQPPLVIGHHIAVALLGTFFGIFGSYCIFSPMSTNLEHKAREEGVYLQIIKASLIAFARGVAPLMAVEFGRRARPGEV